MTNAQIRDATGSLMACGHCQARRLITPDGLVCENGCGRLVLADFTAGGERITPSELRRAWPERVIEVADVTQYGKTNPPNVKE